MSMVRAVLLSTPIACGMAVLPLPATANLITNGGFEQYDGGTLTSRVVTPGSTPSQLGANAAQGYTQLTGWTVSSGVYGFLMNAAALSNGSHTPRYRGTFCLWGAPTLGACGSAAVVANGLTISPDGGNVLALDGAASFRGSGISQTLSGLTVGQGYQLDFSWAAAQQAGFVGATTERMKVTFGTQAQTTATYPLASKGFSGWMRQTMTFTASATSQMLNFLALGTPDGQPPFVLLDGVSMTRVPEPASLALFGVAVAGLGVARRRRRA